jgi:hypothetical protein
MRRMSQPPYSLNLTAQWLLFVCHDERETRTDSGRWRRPVFLNPYKRFWGVSIRRNWTGYFRLGYSEFKK